MPARLPALVAILSTLPLSPLLGQNVSVDEAAFRIYRDGALAGREEFSIRRVGAGDQARVVLRGTIRMNTPDGPLAMSPMMDTQGAGLQVSGYQIDVSGAESTAISVTRSGTRYLVREISSQGERLREFRAGPGSILLDEGVAHHYYLLTPFLEHQSAVSLTILTPRLGSQTRMTLTHLGEEEIRVGDRLVQARHFRLDGSEDSRDVWFDDQGRVLRVEVPSRAYVAERETLT